jgi:IclR family pca regulon transcriptional regulator
MLNLLGRMANKTDIIASFAKGLRVIEAFGADRPRLSITDVAGLSGLDRATARRCLLTLHELGYADYDGKFFQLTPRVLRLGMGALAALPLPQIVQPWLDQLSARTKQSASVSILDETEIVYIARAATTRIMSIGLMPGSRLPAHCTSMGRVLLAALPPEEARGLLDRSDLSPRTAFSLTDPENIMARLSQVRDEGFAVIEQEVELGVRSIAVPVVNMHGKTVAAINIGLGLGSNDMINAYLGPLQEAQAGLKRVLR